MAYTFHNFRNKDTINALRDQIDAQTRSLAEEMRRLRTQRNELSPISILPPEVFSEIIRYCVASSTGLVYHLSSIKEVYRQHLILSCICQSWRKAMLNDRALWTDIRTRYVKHAPVLLERCGTAPVSLSLKGSFRGIREKVRFKEALDVIATKCPPLKYLSLDHELVRQRFLPFLWDPAPNLFHCEIVGGAATSSPRTLFAGSAPRLTVLILEGVEFTWDMPLLYAVPLLQELKITNATNKPTHDELYAVLSSMDKLQKIAFSGDNSLPSYNLDHPPEVPSITFRHVDKLSIQGTAQECTSFLTWTAFETYPSFTVECTDDLREDTYRMFQPWLFNLWTLQGRQNLIHTLEIGTEFVHAHSYARGSHRSRSVELYLSWSNGRDIRAGFQSWLLQLLQLSKCREFTTSIDLSQDDWSTCLTMEHLEDIKLTQAESISLISESLTISGEMDIPLPKLRVLEVESQLTDPEVNKFLAMLRCRKRRGLELGYVLVGVANLQRQMEVQAMGAKVAENFEVRWEYGHESEWEWDGSD